VQLKTRPNSVNCGVNEDWRSKICEWSYQVIDHFDYDRDIVAVSLNYLDRYLSRCPVNKRTFQLVAMTCLYMACKLYDSRKLCMASFIELSRGYFSEEHMTAMEESILNKLSWHLHPPTPLTFVHQFAALLRPSAGTICVWDEMMEVAKFLTELAVYDYHFAPLKSSSVGLAALLATMDGADSFQLSDADKQGFADNVVHVAQISPTDVEVMDCHTRLRALCYEHGLYQHFQEAVAVDAAAAYAEQEQAPAQIPANVPAQAPAQVPAQASVQAQAHPQVQAASEQQPSAGRTARGAETGGRADSPSIRSNSPKGVDMTGGADGSYSSGGKVAAKTLKKDSKTTDKPIRKSGSKGSKSSRAKKRQQSKAVRSGPKTRAEANRAVRKNRRSGSS